MRLVSSAELIASVDARLGLSMSPGRLTVGGFLFELMRGTGCRWNECADVSKWERLNADQVKLKPSKRNGDRVFDAASLPGWFVWMIDNDGQANWLSQRMTFESELDLLMRPHVWVYEGKRVRMHIFRHVWIREQLVLDRSISQVQNDLGLTSATVVSQYASRPIFDLHTP